MAKETNAVIVDTYAIIADLLGEAPRTAREVLDRVRTKSLRGIIHFLVIYELAYHYIKGRLPFLDVNELMEFLRRYFSIVNLSPVMAVRAAEIKFYGDKLLKQSISRKLKRRSLSIGDALTIYLAKSLNAPILTGDADLTYVAREFKVKVIW